MNILITLILLQMAFLILEKCTEVTPWEYLSFTFDYKVWFKFYPVVLSWRIQRLLHFHLGYNDVSLIWIVKGKIYDFLFFKIR